MKLVFCGTPPFAVPTLRAIHAAGHTVALAISQPDKPVGRSGELFATPVKQAALALGIPVEQPSSIRKNDELRGMLDLIAPDSIIVVAYGRILPPWMLDLPRIGCINGHASLLPRWRGAAPIQWAIAGGDDETGVTTMLLNEGLDTGPMLLRRAVPITSETTSPELFVSLAEVGAALMVDTLRGLEAGTITPEPQNGALATPAPMLTRDDAHIDWSLPADVIERRFRAFQPWPGAFTSLRGKKLIVHAMRVAKTHGLHQEPGTVVAGAELLVHSGGGTGLLLEEVQLEGKKRLSAAEFLRGYQLRTGERLG